MFERIATPSHFLAWLGAQDPRGAYSYCHCTDCAFARFLRFIGVHDPSVGGDYWRVGSSDLRYDLDPRVARSLPGCAGPMTYGALAQRLRAEGIR